MVELSRRLLISLRLLQSERDPAARQVVRVDLDLVSRRDADVVLPHLRRDAGEDVVPAVELYPEHRARQRLHDLPLQLDLLFLYRQSTPCAPDTITTEPALRTRWSLSQAASNRRDAGRSL